MAASEAAEARGPLRIVMFSMTPLFRDRSMGGAQKQLKKVALHLAETGHEVTILCTRRSDASEPFHWHPRARVLPIFRFKQPFPEPYATPVYNIAAAVQDMGEHLAQADRYYSHDGGLILPYVYQDIPAVVSLRSILFSETLQSGFLFQGDALILPSEHTRQAYLHTVGRFFPELAERAHVIHNGFDWDILRPTAPGRIRELIPVDPTERAVVLYPHRPEADKGILELIDIAGRLVHEHGIHNLSVLVPQWIDTAHSADVRGFYTHIEEQIAARGLREHFIFHPWVPDDLIAEYYSMGHVTLCPGRYVETFGNTVPESLGCGTPAVITRVGPYRELLPDGLIDKVDYGDTEAAAAATGRIIHTGQRTPQATMQHLHTHFRLREMVEAYAGIILGARKLGPLRYHLRPLESARFRVAPWCYQGPRGLYHDFRAEYNHDAALLSLLQRCPVGFSREQAAATGITEAALMGWYRDGYLVPIPEGAA